MREINNGIVEDYCSFKVSKLLMEKGCRCQNGHISYTNDGKNTMSSTSSFWDPIKYPIRNITHSLAIKWIRDNWGIHIEAPVWEAIGSDEWVYTYTIAYLPEEFEGAKRRAGHVVTIRSLNAYGATYSGGYDYPEEAVEAALLYTLTHLIE